MIAKKRITLKQAMIVNFPSGFIIGAAPGLIFDIDAISWQMFVYIVTIIGCFAYRDIAREIIETRKKEEEK